MALSSTAHQKADRGSAILAANGPDRRVGGIGVGSAKVASRPRPAATSDEQLRLHVWMCISEAEIRTATAELRFFRAILGDGAPPP